MRGEGDRVARASRELRRRLGLRQVDVIRPGRSRRFVQRLEAGELHNLRVGDVEGHFASLGATVRIDTWWNGAALDRLLDEKHASLVERVVSVLRSHGWSTLTEVTFSKWGERGSLDVFAGYEAAGAVFVVEVKSEWGSIEETNRRLDVKARLAPDLAEERFGWRPRIVSRVLVLPDEMTARRIAARHRETFDVAYPARSREVRRWIKRPVGPLRGLWFLSEARRS